MPRLSIVIPAKNEERVLPTLLESIRAQFFRDYEIFVADAQSTDRTAEIAREYDATVVEGGMPGPGRNRGAAQARGDVIAFFDADVQLPSQKFLQECLAEMDRKKLDIATCKVKPLSRKPIDRALHEAYNAYVSATEHIRPHAPGFCIFVRRDAHQAINGFDEDVVFAEDHDYAQRAQQQGFRFGLLRAHPIAASVRRLEKDGRLTIALRYIFVELRTLANGPYKEMPFPYEMGGERERSDDLDPRFQGK